MHPVAAPANSHLGQEYRLPRSYFWLGIVCAIFFFVAGVTSAWAAWTNIDGSFRYPKETAVGFAIFWGLFLLLSLYVLRAYLIERLLVWEDRVKVIGSFRTREAKFAEVERARWRLWGNPGGSVVLHGPGGRVVIYFANYGRVHAERLRDFLRAAIPVERQEGWDRFTEVFIPTPQKTEKARRAAKWGFAIFAVFGAVLLGVGIADPLNDPVSRWQSIIFGALTVVFGAYCFARVSRQPPNTDTPAGVPADRPATPSADG
jgi:hypothetical protein